MVGLGEELLFNLPLSTKPTEHTLARSQGAKPCLKYQPNIALLDERHRKRKLMKDCIFATGTPISNSMTEMYTMQRYLQYGTLQRNNMTHFDAWASTFGETSTAIELAPEGTGYRARTRFSKFFNLPELMSMFKEVADIKTADQLNLPTPTPHYETVGC